MRVIPRERLERVEQLLLEGRSDREIQRAVAGEYRVTRRAARRYLERVKTRLKTEAASRDPEVDRLRIEGMLRGAFETASQPYGVRGPDAKAMVAAARTLAELHGLMGARRVEVTGKGGGPVETVAKIVLLPPIDDDPAAADPLAPQPGAADAVPGVSR